MIFQRLDAARAVGEDVAVLLALQAPEPAQQLVDVHACLVHACRLFLANVLQQRRIYGQCLLGIPLQYVLHRTLGEGLHAEHVAHGLGNPLKRYGLHHGKVYDQGLQLRTVGGLLAAAAGQFCMGLPVAVRTYGGITPVLRYFRLDQDAGDVYHLCRHRAYLLIVHTCGSSQE